MLSELHPSLKQPEGHLAGVCFAAPKAAADTMIL